MVEAAYRHHGLDARYINCEVAPERARRRGPRRARDGLGGLQLLDPAQGRRDRASRRPRRVGRDHRRGQLRRAPRRPLRRREHRRQGLPRLAAHGRRSRRRARWSSSAPAARRARSPSRPRSPARRAITIVNRDAGAARSSSRCSHERTPAQRRARRLGRAFAVPEATDIVVNATSIGLYPDVDARARPRPRQPARRAWSSPT